MPITYTTPEMPNGADNGGHQTTSADEAPILDEAGMQGLKELVDKMEPWNERSL